MKISIEWSFSQFRSALIALEEARPVLIVYLIEKQETMC